MRKPILRVLSIGLLVATTATAADDYDPLDERAVLAYAEKAVIDEGSSALTDLGKRLLGAAADAYLPGAGSLLGLSSGPDPTKQVLDAIEADGTRTRDLIRDFWDWARAQHGAEIDADYATVQWRISSWIALPRSARLPNRDALDAIVADCVNVMARFQTAPRPIDRVDHLHAYLTLLSMAITLEAERSELQILGAEWEFSGGGDPADWWEGLGGDEQSWITDAIEATKQQRVEDLLLPGLEISFADQMFGMDRGTLPGGLPGYGDFQLATSYQFSGVSSGYPPDGVTDGQARWFYFVGHDDPQPHCANKTSYCRAYTIYRGTWNSGCGTFRYLVDFEGAYDPPCYPSDLAPYQHHQQLVHEDMMVRGYGAARVLSESWWDVWELGDRERLWSDNYVDAYLANIDSRHERALTMLANQMTKDITPGQKSRLYGFVLGEGLDAAVQLVSAAANGRDYMNGSVGGTAATRFDWSVHRSAIRIYPASFDELSKIYRSVPVAKLVAAKLI